MRVFVARPRDAVLMARESTIIKLKNSRDHNKRSHKVIWSLAPPEWRRITK